MPLQFDGISLQLLYEPLEGNKLMNDCCCDCGDCTAFECPPVYQITMAGWTGAAAVLNGTWGVQHTVGDGCDWQDAGGTANLWLYWSNIGGGHWEILCDNAGQGAIATWRKFVSDKCCPRGGPYELLSASQDSPSCVVSV